MGCKCSSEVREPGLDIRDQYKFGKLLGSGAFGQVRECANRSNDTVHAVKIMEKSKERGHWSHENMLRREVSLLGRLDHPNIVRYYGFYEDRHFLYAVMEKCDGGELFEQVIKRRKFDESDAATIFKQMLQSVQYIHGFDIVHRDIKAENFLFKTKHVESELKLIDFGMSARLTSKDEMLTEVCGSPHYLAPELIRRSYNCKADIWALGVLLYLLLYGKYPFDGKSTNAIVKDILNKKIDWTTGGGHPSSDAIDILQNLLERKQELRFSAADALDHRWVRQNAKSTADAVPLDMNTLLSASRRVSLKKGKIDPKAAKRREERLKELETEWAVRSNCINMSGLSQPRPRPEFSRKNHRMCTTPSRVDDTCVIELEKLRLSSQGFYKDVSQLSQETDTSDKLSPGKVTFSRRMNRSHSVDVSYSTLMKLAREDSSSSNRLPTPDRMKSKHTIEFALAAMAATEPRSPE